MLLWERGGVLLESATGLLLECPTCPCEPQPCPPCDRESICGVAGTIPRMVEVAISNVSEAQPQRCGNCDQLSATYQCCCDESQAPDRIVWEYSSSPAPFVCGGTGEDLGVIRVEVAYFRQPSDNPPYRLTVKLQLGGGDIGIWRLRNAPLVPCNWANFTVPLNWFGNTLCRVIDPDLVSNKAVCVITSIP